MRTTRRIEGCLEGKINIRKLEKHLKDTCFKNKEYVEKVIKFAVETYGCGFMPCHLCPKKLYLENLEKLEIFKFKGEN